MVAYTPTVGLTQVANSSFVGTWDVPTNANWLEMDSIVGGVATISLNNSPVTLTTAQMQCNQITFNSTLTGNVVVTFPVAIPSSVPVTCITKPYTIYNVCTGSSAFTITLATTASTGKQIGCKPGEPFDAINDGTSFLFKNMQHVGSYWDYAGSSVPNWVTACTVPPYLNCDGTAFSSATYPTLATILGGVTLPDSQGSVRATLNQGTTRLTSTGGGVDGNTNLSRGGSQVTTLSSVHVPPVPITDNGHIHAGSAGAGFLNYGGTNAGFYGGGALGQGISIASAFTGISAGSTSPTAFSNLPPLYVGGLTLIRAA